jgi:hypothetical protein
MKRLIVLAILGIVTIVLANHTTIFVVPPIGMLPDGRTLVLLRHSAVLNFVDSADAICDRTTVGVSLLCRGMTMALVVKDNEILIRLPFSQALYLVSTGGKTWTH